MGIRRLVAIADVDLELDHRIDFSTLTKARHYAREELSALGGDADISVIPIGRHTGVPEDPEEEAREYQSTVLIVKDRTRPLAAATLYLHATQCAERMSDEHIGSRWDEEQR